MKNNKFIILALFIPILALAIIKYGTHTATSIPAANNTNVKSNASWVDHYSNIDSMSNKADLIIVGKITDSKPEKRFDVVFTKQIVTIEKNIKGNKSKGSTVEVLQTGGQLGNTITPEIIDAPLFQKNDKLLLFLNTTDEGPYLVLGGYQGVGKIVNNKIKVNVEEDEIGKTLKDKDVGEIERAILNSLEK